MDEQTKRYQLLHNAALEGDLPSLIKLIQEDQYILDRFIIDKLAHFNQTPLHVASAKGHLEIVKALLGVNPSMCFVRDHDGMNPIHVAAISGRNHVIDELIQVNPHVVNERTNGGESVLHLCVKHNQLETLKHLVDVTDDGELLNSKDSHDNTILHLAVAAKQIEITLWRWMATKDLYIALPLPFTTTKLPSPYMQMINFLVNKRRMKKNVMNKNGSTAMDILENKKGVNDKEICKSLKRAQAIGAEEAKNPTKKQPDAWLKKQRSALMVVASLIATMAFQVGTNPPGGFWQDITDSHTAGFSVMADTNNGAYNRLITSNTIGLISSLSVIILLISGLPCKQLFVVLLMIVMWIAVTSTAYTYLTSIQFVSHLKNEKSISFKVIAISCLVWVILMNSLLIGHTIRFLFKIIRQLYRFVIKLYDNTYVRPRNRSAV